MSANLESVIFQNVLGEHVPRTPRLDLKKNFSPLRGSKSPGLMLVWLTKFYLSFNASLIEHY